MLLRVARPRGGRPGLRPGRRHARGPLVELARSTQLFGDPQHPYTRRPRRRAAPTGRPAAAHPPDHATAGRCAVGAGGRHGARARPAVPLLRAAGPGPGRPGRRWSGPSTTSASRRPRAGDRPGRRVRLRARPPWPAPWPARSRPPPATIRLDGGELDDRRARSPIAALVQLVTQNPRAALNRRRSVRPRPRPGPAGPRHRWRRRPTGERSAGLLARVGLPADHLAPPARRAERRRAGPGGPGPVAAARARGCSCSTSPPPASTPGEGRGDRPARRAARRARPHRAAHHPRDPGGRGPRRPRRGARTAASLRSRAPPPRSCTTRRPSYTRTPAGQRAARPACHHHRLTRARKRRTGRPEAPRPCARRLEPAASYLRISMTRPAPTVRPPSRMANRRPSSMAIGCDQLHGHRRVVTRHAHLGALRQRDRARSHRWSGRRTAAGSSRRTACDGHPPPWSTRTPHPRNRCAA